ncbi:hypothetical protein F2Q70_00005253 [Brassica cretica]|uniref:Uncharacterized protein n=1 Tax=Brassica cretica TaxID=69181 RepID=A0A8S9ILK7_BRACR|nr:hypothetical protein F2Q70_00005253 [Brassica cretica]
MRLNETVRIREWTGVAMIEGELVTCRLREGLRQKQLLTVIPLHHKHYILPNSVNKRVHFSPLRRSESRQNHHQAISRLQPSVKALVNVVDHLGTVASKLTDLFDQQSSDISTMELRASCVSQQLLTCRTYIDKEGLRQQQLLAVIPLHHKHYILPSKKFLLTVDAPASKSLSWHLGSETKSTDSTLKGTTTIA